jgi:hypothetical protein
MIKKQISTSTIFLIVVIILYVLVLLLQPKRYYTWYPTLPIYPDNAKEIDFMVNEYISKRTQDDIDFFYLTDDSPINAFKSKISEELYTNLSKIITSYKVISRIILYKIIFNRARPKQISPEKINAPKSNSAATPAYPSGHAYQSYYAAKVLSLWEPARKKEWDEIAERAAYIRVYMGIHYPSDVRYAKLLVDDLQI